MTTGAPIPTYPNPGASGGATGPGAPRRRRSKLRRYLPLGLAVWLVLEIWLLTLVAGQAGGLAVFLLLVAGVVLGSVVIKRAGRRAFRNLNEALQRGSAPTRGGGNGLMMLGGLLLIIPGLISDAAGLLLLLPPVQKAVSSYTERKLLAAARAPGSLGDAYQQVRIHRPDGKVVQGEVIRDEP
ncbi:FxsA family membrane protein [Streptomyces antibioticus]|uniref:FxsA family membrane protein n=1 Tax=Streptomyces antibioticus TaxID=1890 RepID=UPI00225B2D0F|nr:FxsA family membrane protein [Streptomyces antibioticus]MCX4740421.1 FxsA family protein [Streptomyces antibioticus]